MPAFVIPIRHCIYAAAIDPQFVLHPGLSPGKRIDHGQLFVDDLPVLEIL